MKMHDKAYVVNSKNNRPSAPLIQLTMSDA